MRVTNMHKSPLGLSNGVVLEPGKSTLVRDWDQVSKNHIVAAWVRAKIIRIDGAETPAPASKADYDHGEAAEREEKDQLIAELKTFGIDKNRRSSVETLRELLAEAKAGASTEGDQV